MTTPMIDLLVPDYRVIPEPFWAISQMRGDDGYDRIEAARRFRWTAIPAWGRDGWDLGSWPLVVVFHRQSPGRFELAENVEGDVTVYCYMTRELRDEATDQLAFWHWRHDCEDWVQGIGSLDQAPHLRGAYSSRRGR